MKTYLIIFSFKEDKSKSIIDRIKSRWMWARVTSTSWCIKTNTEISEIRDELSVETTAHDRVFIVDITDSSWASNNLPEEVTKWLKE